MKLYEARLQHMAESGVLIELTSLNWQFTYHGALSEIGDAIRNEVSLITDDNNPAIAINWV